MQFTLPLKEKQIEQSRLEAQARKEATIKNAEAEGEAKVIDSKAEFQRRNLLAEAEANRIRVTAAADAERMQGEARLLNQAPLADQQDHCRAPFRQNPGDDGARRRQVLLCQRRVQGLRRECGGQGRRRPAGRRQPRSFALRGGGRAALCGRPVSLHEGRDGSPDASRRL